MGAMIFHSCVRVKGAQIIWSDSVGDAEMEAGGKLATSERRQNSNNTHCGTDMGGPPGPSPRTKLPRPLRSIR